MTKLIDYPYCKHCKHCNDKMVEEDYNERKIYVETSRINMYLDGMDIEETEQYLIEHIYGHKTWSEYSRDIPISKELFNKWRKKEE